MGTSEQIGDAQTIALPAVLDLAAADALLATLRQSVAIGRACNLDASQVETLLLPGIQVILAAIRSGDRVEVINPSPAFCAAFDEVAISWQRGAETVGHAAG